MSSLHDAAAQGKEVRHLRAKPHNPDAMHHMRRSRRQRVYCRYSAAFSRRKPDTAGIMRLKAGRIVKFLQGD